MNAWRKFIKKMFNPYSNDSLIENYDARDMEIHIDDTHQLVQTTKSNVRHSFVIKSLAFLIPLYIYIFEMLVLFYNNANIRSAFASHKYVALILIVFYGSCMVMARVFEEFFRHKAVAVVSTFFMAHLLLGILSIITCGYNLVDIPVSFLAAIIVLVLLFVFCFQTKVDITCLYLYLVMLAIDAVVIAVASVLFKFSALRVFGLSVGVVLHSAYLLTDLCLQVSGKHRYDFTVKDYLFSTFSSFVDLFGFWA